MEYPEIIRVLLKICMVLKFMHSKNVIYRDIKLQNILLKKRLFVKFFDLHLAKSLTILS